MTILYDSGLLSARNPPPEAHASDRPPTAMGTIRPREMMTCVGTRLIKSTKESHLLYRAARVPGLAMTLPLAQFAQMYRTKIYS